MNLLVFGTPTATWALAVPNDPTLVGTRFVQQGFVLDAGANQTGIAVSNAAAIKIGL